MSSAVARPCLAYLSGVSKEWWTKAQAGRAGGLLSGNDWTYQMHLLSAAQERKKIFIAITYGPSDDVSSMEYARASFLLFANGRRSAQTFSTGCAGEPASRYWRESVGAPLGAASSNGAICRRRFTNGIVVGNPSPATTGGASSGGALRTALWGVTHDQIRSHCVSGDIPPRWPMAANATPAPRRKGC